MITIIASLIAGAIFGAMVMALIIGSKPEDDEHDR